MNRLGKIAGEFALGLAPLLSLGCATQTAPPKQPSPDPVAITTPVEQYPAPPAYFRGVVTKVTSTNKIIAQINLTRQHKVQVGMKYFVYRGERILGHLNITYVDDLWSAGVLVQIDRHKNIVPGDKIQLAGPYGK